MISDPVQTRITHLVKSGVFPPELGRIASEFCRDYQRAVPLSPEKGRDLLLQLIDLAAQQILDPYPFECIHHKIRAPFDYTQFGLDLLKPLVDRERSTVLGQRYIAQIEQTLRQGESCILFANHQIEADPQIMHLLLAQEHPLLTEMYYVAGDRVTTDPLAVPLSLGTNLVCIFSKKHIEHPPELKEAKRQHNRRAMQQLSEQLGAGGCCVWIAPSGGRDRANAHGKVEVAPFDPQSIELFHLLAKQSPRPVHFYPLALVTHDLLPPPQGVHKEIGEPRKIQRTSAHLAFGAELDLPTLGENASDKKTERRLRAEAVWQCVNNLYSKAISNASAMLDT